LPGEFQVRNAAVAASLAVKLNMSGNIPLTDDAIRQGIAAASWPGRFEIIERSPTVVLDGGHNPDAAQTMVNAFKHKFSDRKAVGVLGIMADKDVPGLLDLFSPLLSEAFCAAPLNDRAMKADALAQIVRDRGLNAAPCASTADAVKKAMDKAGPDGLVLVTGSLFLVGEARSALGLAEQDPI